MNNNGTLTIFEASQLTGKSHTTIHRYIKKGLLPCKKVLNSGKQVLTVLKSDVEKVFNASCYTGLNSITHDVKQVSNGFNNVKDSIEEEFRTDITEDVKQCLTDVKDSVKQVLTDVKQGVKQDQESLTAERVREVIEDFFSTKQAELVKPMEQQALYKLGRIEEQNISLQHRLETILEENRILQEEKKDLQNKFKAIPDLQKEKEILKVRLLQEKEQAIKELEVRLKQEEKEKVRAKSKAEEAIKQLTALPAPVESINQILLDNANNLKKLTSEKAKIEIQIKELDATVKEKELSLADLHKLHRQEIEKLKAESEESQKVLSEEWQKKVEELSRPWWKFW